MGPAFAADLLITGRVIKAQEALQMGLVNKVADDAMEESLKFAKEICMAAPLSVKTTVKALRLRQEATGLGLEVRTFLSRSSKWQGYFKNGSRIASMSKYFENRFCR